MPADSARSPASTVIWGELLERPLHFALASFEHVRQKKSATHPADPIRAYGLAQGQCQLIRVDQLSIVFRRLATKDLCRRAPSASHLGKLRSSAKDPPARPIAPQPSMTRLNDVASLDSRMKVWDENSVSGSDLLFRPPNSAAKCAVPGGGGHTPKCAHNVH